MAEIALTVNGTEHSVNVDPNTPLLWVLRDTLGLTGTKYSCGIGLCGSCTVHLDGRAIRSCKEPVSAAKGNQVITIEGLAAVGGSAIQQAWIEENVPQCGYCQPGQIMMAAALLRQKPDLSDEEIKSLMSGNLCRCGTYGRIRQAIRRAAEGQISLTAAEPPVPEPVVSNSAAWLGGALPLVGALAVAGAGSKDKMNRRGFLKVASLAGAGLLIGVYLPACQQEPPEIVSPTAPPATATAPAPSPTATTPALSPTADATTIGTSVPPPLPSPTFVPSPTIPPSITPTVTPEPTAFFEPNLFLTIDNNGLVTIIVHRIELGQGARTALPMIVAEELEVDLSTVHVEQAPGDLVYGKQQTAGSSCIQETFSPLRLAGAQAREMLITAAAQTWDVDEESCYAENGAVVHEPTGRRLPYAELVATAATLPPVWGQPKDVSEYKLIGTSVGHVDNPKIVDGSATFGIDVELPGLLFAAIVRGPELRCQVADFDAAGAEAIDGVRQVIPLDIGLAVVADSTWAALEGKRALEVTWESGRYADLNSVALRQSYRDQFLGDTGGDGKLEAIYEMSFLAHATPSPMNCVADVREDSCQVWAPTQSPQLAKSRVLRLTGLPSEAVTLHVPRVGGGFGRRLQVEYVEAAVQISQAVGAPVKVIWSREEDIRQDYYHPLSVHLASASLDEPRMPRIRSQTYGEWDNITGAWRAVSNFTDGFVRECFLDEMAEAFGQDPVELRLALLPAALKNVVETTAAKAGWGTPLPAGWGRGIAAYSTWNVTPVAMVAEVSTEQNLPQVHRVVCAIDCGLVINPDLVKAQMEGGIAWGLSALLGSGITIENGRVQQSNFHDYPILSMDQMPAVEVHIIPSSRPPTGVGEMGVPPIAPAVLNAYYAATGKRIRQLPMRPVNSSEPT